MSTVTLQQSTVDAVLQCLAIRRVADGDGSPEDFALAGVAGTLDEWADTHTGDDESELYERADDLALEVVRELKEAIDHLNQPEGKPTE